MSEQPNNPERPDLLDPAGWAPAPLDAIAYAEAEGFAGWLGAGSRPRVTPDTDRARALEREARTARAAGDHAAAARAAQDAATLYSTAPGWADAAVAAAALAADAARAAWRERLRLDRTRPAGARHTARPALARSAARGHRSTTRRATAGASSGTDPAEGDPDPPAALAGLPALPLALIVAAAGTLAGALLARLAAAVTP